MKIALVVIGFILVTASLAVAMWAGSNGNWPVVAAMLCSGAAVLISLHTTKGER